ncbi:MAG: DUF2147 domain-containing protein [Flavobacteriales bacterium]|nr:MAG: DUF2147 domain-containing protein [Flavobacteriales bacterium TMED96]RZP11890.1 MAG: DUF2147 domain-containing protein [Flavobacteriales bacterium]
MIFKIILFAYILVNSYQTNQIEGVWITQDDETGKKKSEVLLYKNEGKLYGKILNLLLEQDKGKLCVNCKGENKNLAIEGMVIVEGLKLNGKTWEDGTILDPKSGKTYSCYITFDDDNTLKVRGYIGFSLLGRTQKWIRKN